MLIQTKDEAINIKANYEN